VVLEPRTGGPSERSEPKTESIGNVTYLVIENTSPKPLTGGVTLASVLAKYETNSVMAGHMADARRKLANVLDSDKSLRSLRLGAGMSQSQLAERSHTTQSYIARVEAGKVDPGTDMISQLASALSVAEDVVFSAVRARRSQRDAVHVR